MKGRTDNSEFNYHPKCGLLKITHLTFVDDLMLFSRGDIISVGIFIDSLADFGRCSGLLANVTKSSLFNLRPRIGGNKFIDKHSCGFDTILPLATKKLKVMFFALFIEKIAGYITAWADASLSHAGRAELICSVLQGVECFWLSIFPILSSTICKISRICRDLLCQVEGTPKGAVLGMLTWNSTGKFRTAIAYDFFKPKGTIKCWANSVWNPCIIPKHSFILWLGAKLKLLTKDMLHYLDIDRNCVLVSKAFWEELCHGSPAFATASPEANFVISVDLQKWLPTGSRTTSCYVSFFRHFGSHVVFSTTWIRPRTGKVNIIGLRRHVLPRGVGTGASTKQIKCFSERDLMTDSL
ncbi:Reverse transcriptase domain-containing protein [Abeliophyllum distichum]|uniref:Reverse transcriptase domain-containing protein n=1 Tax=Abeliophyllum distichum TaxID=126358 RepID=A0ABD1QG28_9LAMI